MIKKGTVVDQIEITRTGVVQIRLALVLIEDGVEIDSKWHRTILPPGCDIDAQMKVVNEHLSQMGKEPVGPKDIAGIKTHAKAAWTPKIISSYAAAQEVS